MRLSPQLLLGPPLVLLACGETSYDLYTEKPLTTAGGTGGAAEGTGGTSATPTGGQMHTGGDINRPPPGDPTACEASRDAELELIRLVATASGLCVSQGAPTIIGDSPAFEIELATCEVETAQFWSLVASSGGLWQIHNEAAAMNLDVRFADTTDGTPLVLFDPHGLYNQRFYVIPASGDSFQLAPRHTTGKCLEVRDGDLEIWPCSSSEPNQRFMQIACNDDI
jgi:hypothetical protein